MKPVLKFEDIEIGKRYDRISYQLTSASILKYLDSVRNNHPMHHQKSASGSILAPSTICASDVFKLPLMQTFWDGIELCDPPEKRRALLHAKHEIKFINPPHSDMKIEAEGFVADKYIDRGRYWIVLEISSKAEDGAELLRCRATFTWPAEMKPGQPAARKKVSKREIPIGKEIQPLEKLVTLDLGKQYSGWPEEKNYHTDEKIAHEFGYPSILMQAFMGVAHLSELCHGFFGDSWYQKGNLIVKFISVVFLPVCLTAKGVFREKTGGNTGKDTCLDIWLEDDKGIKVQVGEASCPV